MSCLLATCSVVAWLPSPTPGLPAWLTTICPPARRVTVAVVPAVRPDSTPDTVTTA